MKTKEEKNFLFYDEKISRFLKHAIKKEIRKLKEKEKVIKERQFGGEQNA